jgi:hypothetical protein
MARYESYLNKEGNKWLEYYWGTRKFLFLARWSMYSAAFRFHFRFGHEFRFWLPGVEVKYACEAADKVGAQIEFMGSEMNAVTNERLMHETRMLVPHYLWRRYMYNMTQWTDEMISNRHKIA